MYWGARLSRAHERWVPCRSSFLAPRGTCDSAVICLFVAELWRWRPRDLSTSCACTRSGTSAASVSFYPPLRHPPDLVGHCRERGRNRSRLEGGPGSATSAPRECHRPFHVRTVSASRRSHRTICDAHRRRALEARKTTDERATWRSVRPEWTSSGITEPVVSTTGGLPFSKCASFESSRSASRRARRVASVVLS